MNTPEGPQDPANVPLEPTEQILPIIEEQAEQPIPGVHAHSEHIFTVPNGMTLARFIAGVALPVYMAKGGEHVFPFAATAAGTDKEGTVAGLIDRYFPGWGRTELGKRADPIADTTFGAGFSVGTILSPRMPLASRVGAAISTAKVAEQTAWAVRADKRHREEFGEPLVADVDKVGKLATALMLTGAATSALASDLNPENKVERRLRFGLGLGSVALAGAGYALGKRAWKQHDRNLQAKIAAHRAEQAEAA